MWDSSSQGYNRPSLWNKAIVSSPPKSDLAADSYGTFLRTVQTINHITFD